MKKSRLFILLILTLITQSAFLKPGTGRENRLAPTPCNLATFVRDVTIPDDGVGKGPTLRPGTPFRKTWEIKNVGTCTWDSRYRWAFDTGHIMSGPLTQALTKSKVKPGQTLQVSVDLVAPATPGVYTGYWYLMDPQGKEFRTTLNKSLWVTIKVSPPFNSSSSSSIPISANAANRTIYFPFRDCAPSRLYVGDTVYVSYGGRPNGIRSAPDVHPDNIFYRAPQGEQMEIRSGPRCSWGWLIWEVMTETGHRGWTPESNGEEFWLIPLDEAPDLPGWLKSDRRAYDAYQQASAIMQDRRLSDNQKADKLRILQRTFGEELLTTVIRYVPVYDDQTGSFLSFDSYMRRFASQEGYSTTRAPIEQDPVGAGMSLFFNPSIDNIQRMLGLP